MVVTLELAFATSLPAASTPPAATPVEFAGLIARVRGLDRYVAAGEHHIAGGSLRRPRYWWHCSWWRRRSPSNRAGSRDR